MALKYQVDTLEGVDEAHRPLYTEKDGKYVLAVDGVPAPADDLAERLKKLEANNAALLDEKKKASAEAKKAADAAEAARLEAAKKSGDVDALEKSWQQKMNDAIAAKDAEVNQYQGMVSSLTVGSTAATLAAELFGEHAELMMPHINSRLSFEIVDGKPRVRVRDQSGQVSALTLDELKKEIQSDRRFAPFVVASRASGAGGHGGQGSPAGKKFSDYTSAELADIRRKNPQEYERLKAEAAKG